MNISRINTYSPSFGKVRKSAAEMAIKHADGDIKKLRTIEILTKGQGYNKRWDVVWSDAHRSYAIVKRDDNSDITPLATLTQACYLAEEFDKTDKTGSMSVNSTSEQKTIARILDICED